jgi:Sulfotransferase domain
MARTKCFGIGLNKTGTKTLSGALRQLGHRVPSFRADLMEAFGEARSGPAIAVAEHYDGFEDWPWLLLYKELDWAFPGSKFILTTRLDTAAWFESLCKHSTRTGETTFRNIAYRYVNRW